MPLDVGDEPSDRNFAVADFPVLEFSNKEVLKAGEALKGNLVWLPQTEDEIRKVFRVAHSWRDSHAFPMRSIRSEVSNRLEVQLRTRLQHSWATAVEAIGLLKNQELKAGEGDPDWLRLFALVSAEFACTENCPEPPDVPGRSERIKEIRRLNEKLGAFEVLNSLRYAARALDQITTREQASYYLVEYNHENKSVDVRSRFKPKEMLLAYGAKELDAISTINAPDTVLIEAEKVEDLKAAYPNYFGDVKIFTENLRVITRGEMAREYTMPPKYPTPRRREPISDLSWLRPGKRRQWK